MIKIFLTILFCCFASVTVHAAVFKFEDIVSREEMISYLQKVMPLGTGRDAAHKIFIQEGGATFKSHPIKTGVEKYIYDINLCDYYIWRWNISADYDASGKLLQIYMNGTPIHAGGQKDPEVPKEAELGKKASIYKAKRPRPEASKGENSLAFILFDRDSDEKTITDQVSIGAGPSRVDPANMGKLVMTEADPWRTIFDYDAADKIMPYHGDCQPADEAYKDMKGQNWR